MSDDFLCELLLHGLCQDAETIGCAHGSQLEPYLAELIAIQDNIARAIQKARKEAA